MTLAAYGSARMFTLAGVGWFVFQMGARAAIPSLVPESPHNQDTLSNSFLQQPHQEQEAHISLSQPLLLTDAHSHSRQLKQQQTGGRALVYYVIPFVVGVNINNWMSVVAPVSIGPDLFKNLNKYGLAAWMIAGFAAISLSGMLLYLFYLVCAVANKQKRRCFCSAYISLFLYYSLFFLALHSRFTFHLHHNNIGIWLLPLTNFANRPAASAVQALCLGLFVNGFSSYGYAATFDPIVPSFDGDVASPHLVSGLQNSSTTVLGPTFAVVGWNMTFLQPSSSTDFSPIFNNWQHNQNPVVARGVTLSVNGVEVLRQWFNLEGLPLFPNSSRPFPVSPVAGYLPHYNLGYQNAHLRSDESAPQHTSFSKLTQVHLVTAVTTPGNSTNSSISVSLVLNLTRLQPARTYNITAKLFWMGTPAWQSGASPYLQYKIDALAAHQEQVQFTTLR